MCVNVGNISVHTRLTSFFISLGNFLKSLVNDGLKKILIKTSYRSTFFAFSREMFFSFSTNRIKEPKCLSSTNSINSSQRAAFILSLCESISRLFSALCPRRVVIVSIYTQYYNLYRKVKNLYPFVSPAPTLTAAS